MNLATAAADPPTTHDHVSWRPGRRAWAAALLPGAAFMAVFVARCTYNPYGGRRFTLFDDAMISMTYGRTLADTGELVWFPGADRVQGFTNPLWTLYMSLLHLVGLEGSSAAAAVSITSALALIGTALLVGRMVWNSLPDRRISRRLALMATAAVPFAYPLTYWSLRGMEVGVLSLALALLVHSLMPTSDGRSIDAGRRSPSRRASWLAAVAVTSGVATRLDFAPLAAVAIAFAMTRADTPQSRRRIALGVGVPLAVAVATVLLAQRGYYGHLFPNTYTLKVEGFSVTERLHRGIVVTGKAAPLLVVVVIGALLAARRPSAPERRATRGSEVCVVSAALVATAVAYSTWVGGDAWEADQLLNRYVSVVLPMAMLVAAVGLGVVLDRPQRPSGRSVAGVVALLLVSCAAVGLTTNPFGYEVGVVVLGAVAVAIAALGAWTLGRRWNPDPHRSAIAGVVICLLLAFVGGPPLSRWVGAGAAYSDIDQMQSEYGEAMNRLVAEGQVIGTVWAGAPAYYAERPMIDFLGKSDPVVARVAPRGPLHPGHNKWDHEYSIGQLEPRVILQIWATDAETLQMIGVMGYYFRCFDLGTGVGGAYFRLGSGIKEDMLTVCDGLPG